MHLPDHIEGIIHEPTQVTDGTVDLTVNEVYRVADGGRIDFGGGELQSATLERHDRVWRNEDDDYQWWELDSGTYLLDYNETITAPQPVAFQPRSELLDRGGVHPTIIADRRDRMPLTVGNGGIKIKENARITTVRPI